MNYFKQNNEIFAYDNEQVKQGYGKDLTPLPAGDYFKIESDGSVSILKYKLDDTYTEFTKEILEDGTEMYQPQELQDALDALKLEEDKAKQIAEATKYLSDTDWVIVKITEMQLEGVDTTSLMEKYKEELISRTHYRNLINSLEENETPVVETKTNDLATELDQATQKYIDDIITNLGYADLQEVTKYSTYSNIKQLECLKLLDFNTLCWNKSINIKKQVESGEITELTTQEFIALLPRYTA